VAFFVLVATLAQNATPQTAAALCVITKKKIVQVVSIKTITDI
jgi:hypothetical protein